jgi:hypothetical protein
VFKTSEAEAAKTIDGHMYVELSFLEEVVRRLASICLQGMHYQMCVRSFNKRRLSKDLFCLKLYLFLRLFVFLSFFDSNKPPDILLRLFAESQVCTL